MKTHVRTIISVLFISLILLIGGQKGYGALETKKATMTSPTANSIFLFVGKQLKQCSWTPGRTFDINKNCKNINNLSFGGVAPVGMQLSMKIQGVIGTVLHDVKDATIFLRQGQTNFRLPLFEGGNVGSEKFTEYISGPTGLLGQIKSVGTLFEKYVVSTTYQQDVSNRRNDSTLEIIGNKKNEDISFSMPFGWANLSFSGGGNRISCDSYQNKVSFAIKVQALPNTSVLLLIKNKRTNRIISQKTVQTDDNGKTTVVLTNLPIGSHTTEKNIQIIGYTARQGYTFGVADLKNTSNSIDFYNFGIDGTISKCPVKPEEPPLDYSNIECDPPVQGLLGITKIEDPPGSGNWVDAPDSVRGLAWACFMVPAGNNLWSAIGRNIDIACSTHEHNYGNLGNLVVNVSKPGNKPPDYIERTLAAKFIQLWCKPGRGDGQSIDQYIVTREYVPQGDCSDPTDRTCIVPISCPYLGNPTSFFYGDIKKGEHCTSYDYEKHKTVDVTWSVNGQDVANMAKQMVDAGGGESICNQYKTSYVFAELYTFSWAMDNSRLGMAKECHVKNASTTPAVPDSITVTAEKHRRTTQSDTSSFAKQDTNTFSWFSSFIDQAYAQSTGHHYFSNNCNGSSVKPLDYIHISVHNENNNSHTVECKVPNPNGNMLDCAEDTLNTPTYYSFRAPLPAYHEIELQFVDAICRVSLNNNSGAHPLTLDAYADHTNGNGNTNDNTNGDNIEFTGCGQSVQTNGNITVHYTPPSDVTCTPAAGTCTEKGRTTDSITFQAPNVETTVTLTIGTFTCTVNVVSSDTAPGTLEITDISAHSPLIYLSSRKRQEYEVRMYNNKGTISFTQPQSHKTTKKKVSWKLTTIGGLKELKDPLLYEFTLDQSVYFIKPSKGYIRSYDELTSFLYNDLFEKLQLTKKQKDDYLSDIMSRVPKGKYYFVGFLDPQQWGNTVSLETYPKVEKMVRVMLYLEPRNEFASIEEPDLSPYVISNKNTYDSVLAEYGAIVNLAK